jgi:hypothetical protein
MILQNGPVRLHDADGILRDARISADEQYRYWLHRRWGPGVPVAFLMLNPSIADAFKDDATVRKCKGFTEKWGHRAFSIVNLYAFRTPKPEILWEAKKAGVDIVGPHNPTWLRNTLTSAKFVVAAWGNHGDLERGRKICDYLRLIEKPVYSIGPVTKQGQPWHPLMRGYKFELEEFK